MSVNRQFEGVSKELLETLRKQTGMGLGEFSGLILSGHNPSLPSEVEQFAKGMRERRKAGKKHRPRDVDALLDMVEEHMQYQALTGRDRVTFARTVLQRLIPSLNTADLESMSQSDVSKLKPNKKMVKAAKTLLADLI